MGLFKRNHLKIVVAEKGVQKDLLTVPPFGLVTVMKLYNTVTFLTTKKKAVIRRFHFSAV